MNHRTRSAVGAALLAATLTGCGGTTYESADDVIADVQEVLPGCSNVKTGTNQWFVQEARSCTYTQGDGRKDDLSVFMFAGPKPQQNWTKLAEKWGEGFFVEGDGWVIQLHNRTNAGALAEELDGDLR